MHLQAIIQVHGLVVQGLAKHVVSIGGVRLPWLNGRKLQDFGVLAAIVVSPLALWIAKRWIDRWEDGRRREDARSCALDVAVTLARSIQVCEDLRLALETAERVPDATVEAAIESLDFSRHSLRLYLRRQIPMFELIPLAAAAEQRLGEGHQAMLALQEPPGAGAEPGPLYARQLQTTRAELQSVVERLRGLQPDLGRAIAKVDAGWAPPE
jgi:hypothetical protein